MALRVQGCPVDLSVFHSLPLSYPAFKLLQSFVKPIIPNSNEWCIDLCCKRITVNLGELCKHLSKLLSTMRWQKTILQTSRSKEQAICSAVFLQSLHELLEERINKSSVLLSVFKWINSSPRHFFEKGPLTHSMWDAFSKHSSLSIPNHPSLALLSQSDTWEFMRIPGTNERHSASVCASYLCHSLPGMWRLSHVLDAGDEHSHSRTKQKLGKWK